MPKPDGDSETVTLTASTVATVTLDADYDNVEVLNLSGSAEVWYSLDGTTPTVGGDRMRVLPAAVGANSEQPNGGGATVVKLISTGTPKVYVRGW